MLDVSSTTKIVTSSEMQAIEERWFASGEISIENLMDRVGRAVADWIADYLTVDENQANVLVLVGKGNNGGDALVAARYLAERGINTTAAMLLARPANDPLITAFVGAGGNVAELGERTMVRRLSNLCNRATLIVDGVLGINLSRPIEEPLTTLFDVAKNSEKPVVAIDVPSGANSEDGSFDSHGLPADVCLAVGLHKLGPAARFGDDCYGEEIVVLDVGTPDRLTTNLRREANDETLARQLLPARSKTAHKGDFGRALLFAGSDTYVGAASLAVQACLRSGAGMVTLATPVSAYQALAGDVSETTYLPLNEDVNGVLPGPAFNTLVEHIPAMHSVLIGVGLGLSYGARELISRLTSDFDIWRGHTVVLDADGLTMVSVMDRWWEVFRGNLIITPHPGELSRLLGISIAEVEADRVNAVLTAAQRFDCVAVLKGATTLIATPNGRLRVNMEPNDALARGGTGDVLAGLIAGLAAKSDPFDAASLGVYIHSLSAKFASERYTRYAMTAGDLIDYLPRAFRELASE